MINIKYNKKRPVNKTVDPHRNMLIIAEGETNYMLNQIAYYDSTDVVEKLYGYSQLSRAFGVAKEIGVQHVFLVNAKRYTDYIEIVDTLKYYDFAYIVPVGVKMFDTFYNVNLKRQMYFAELYLDSVSDNTSSCFIMTDNHASLYEDCDSFIDDMSEKITKFKNISVNALRNGRNLCFVSNGLVDYEYANLVVASLLCTTPFNLYPSYDLGQAVFDMDDFDISLDEICYFKNNSIAGTSIENLKNFRKEFDAAKIVMIDRVIKFIERELDFSDYKGKPFTDYVRLRLYKKLEDFFRSIKGSVIRDYKVNSINFVRTEPGAGILVNDFTILPENSVEEYNIVMEV